MENPTSPLVGEHLVIAPISEACELGAPRPGHGCGKRRARPQGLQDFGTRSSRPPGMLQSFSLILWMRSVTWSYSCLRSFINRATFFCACMTVVWSRSENSLAMRG